MVELFGIDSLKKEVVQKVKDKIFDLQKCKKYHSKRIEENARNTTIGKRCISNYPSKVLFKSHHYSEGSHDHRQIKKPRNDQSNPRNNKKRAIEKTITDLNSSLFADLPPKELIHIPDNVIPLLNYWKGTKYDILGELGMRK